MIGWDVSMKADDWWLVFKLVVIFMCGVGVGWLNPIELMCNLK